MSSRGLVALVALGAGHMARAAEPEGLPKGVVHFPLSRKAPESWKRFDRRADTVTTSLENQVTLFTTELQIGSTGQTISVQVDTGSSDLWVMETNNPYCSSIVNGSSTTQVESSGNVPSQYRVKCQASAMFNPDESSSYQQNSTSFSIRYGDQSFANGTYAHDDITFAGATIKGANFALASTANSTSAVWGIGLEATEATVTTYDQNGVFSPTYPNIPVQMKAQGLIESTAYSLWLNDPDSQAGSLLFGGVDHAKYNGTLQTVPMVSSYTGISTPNEFRVMLHGLSLYKGSSSQQIVECALPFLLDSGTSFMLLPGQFIEVLIESLGALYSEQGYILVPCDIEGGLTFDLSGINVNVPFQDITLLVSRARNTCALGIQSGGSSFILGDTFLRSVYAVYDLENYEIALAPPRYNVSSSSIDVISSGIPSATPAPSYSSTQEQTSISTAIATIFQAGVGNSGGNSQSNGGSNLGSLSTTSFTDTSPFSGLESSSFSQTSGGSAAAPTSSSLVGSTSGSPSRSTARKNAAAPLAARGSLLASVIAGAATFLLFL